jgi:hypothetical protein
MKNNYIKITDTETGNWEQEFTERFIHPYVDNKEIVSQMNCIALFIQFLLDKAYLQGQSDAIKTMKEMNKK